ncbi:amidohydrolase family protein [Mucilaginibacter corticis]|uniref:Amidohydrolase family protein n=1 Tax=Mucilaginibacter corticis TaxID=2597670 RepID=A0A556MMB2_9SPHI|nr:amidohydrolase family protein [Mucilaginibacter corticis]TSJ41043.1 amidohydrolase family protein [Mucilaginibacter corticis]
MKNACILCYLMLLTGLHVAGQKKPGLLALTDVSIIDANHRQALGHQTVLIRNGRIRSIFTTGSENLPDSATIISIKGKFLLPGLIDSHVHLATDPSGVDNRAHTTGVLKRMLQSGVTTVRDMAGDARVLAGLSREAELDEIPSPDIFYSALMAGPGFFSDPRTATSTQGGVNGDMPYMQAVSDTTDLVRSVARAKGSGASGIKLYADLSAPLVAQIVAEARRQHLNVWGHAWLQQARPSDLVNAGVGSISHAPLLVREVIPEIPANWKTHAHDAGFWDKATPDLSPFFRLMVARDCILDATLLTYKKWAESDTAARWDYEVGKRITAQAYRAGVRICAGTDDDQEQFVPSEMRLLVTDAGFLPIDAITAATRNSAMALGIEKDRGTIEAGKVADFLILDQDPLSNIANIGSVFMVLKNGRVVQKKGASVTIYVK